MGQLADRFNNSAASLVAMCNQSSSKLSLSLALTELLAAIEALEEKLAAQIAVLNGASSADVTDILLVPTASGQLTDRFNNLAASLIAMCNQSGVKASIINAMTELLGAAETLENKLAAQIVALGPMLPPTPLLLHVPVNISPPSISGIAQVGQVLTAATGTWMNSPISFTYQWNDSVIGPILGATSSAYVPASANLGHTLTVSVVATNSGGNSLPATSSSTGVITAASGDALNIDLNLSVDRIPLGA